MPVPSASMRNLTFPQKVVLSTQAMCCRQRHVPLQSSFSAKGGLFPLVILSRGESLEIGAPEIREETEAIPDYERTESSTAVLATLNGLASYPGWSRIFLYFA